MERCELCRFFDPFEDGDGYCRRSAPAAPGMSRQQMNRDGMSGDDMLALWPVVQGEEDWCGDFESPKVTKRTRATGAGRPPKYPFRSMQVGDTFEASDDAPQGKPTQYRAADAANAIGRKYGMRFDARRISDTGILITRTA